MTPADKQKRARIYSAFALVYVLWGSTYLAMRVVVQHMGPALLGGTRFLIAGSVMLAAPQASSIMAGLPVNGSTTGWLRLLRSATRKYGLPPAASPVWSPPPRSSLPTSDHSSR